MLTPKAKATIRTNELEITMLRQAIQAKRVRAALDLTGPQPWIALAHNHSCRHCNTVWRCDCDYSPGEVNAHGCDEQQAFNKKLVIALSMPSKWEAPYLSRRAKPKVRQAKGSVEAKIAANNVELARLRALLG